MATKLFCDICGEPAAESMPSVEIKFEDMAWSGYRSAQGLVSGCDGRWVPTIEARALFYLENQKDNTSKHPPDLCYCCMISMIKFMDTLKRKLEFEAELKKKGLPCQE